MAEHKLTLAKGITIGSVANTLATLRQLTAGDVIEAMEEAEKLLMVPGPNGFEPRLVHSPALMSVHSLRRQIASIGEVKGPLEMEMFNTLSDEDLALLQEGCEKLDAAIAASLEQRGRSAAAGSEG